MSGTIEYFQDMVDCPVCGKENLVDIISEYDPKQGENFNSIVVGQSCCSCQEPLTSF